MKYNKMSATVKGTDCCGQRFTEKLEFTMEIIWGGGRYCDISEVDRIIEGGEENEH